MNNLQLAAAFVAMVNGQQAKKELSTANNMSIGTRGQYLVLYSYYTPIAVYDANYNYVVFNSSFYSATTAKHQSKLNCSRFNCPVAIVNYFYKVGCNCIELVEQADRLYSYEKRQYTASNGRKYTRFVLLKTDKENGLFTAHKTELHRYISEQAASNEADRLNKLAYPH